MSSRFVPPFTDVGSGINTPSGAQLFFLETGSSAPKDTFKDQLSTPTKNSNPVIAGSTGIFGDIFITGKYKVVLKDKDGSQIWEADPIDEFVTGSGQLVNVLSRDTLNDAVIDTSLQDGLSINLKERTTGNGGGALWDVVLASSVTPNTSNIVICTGVPTLALVMRKLEDATTVGTVAAMIATDFIPEQTVKTQGYYPGWAAQLEPQGAASYVISLLSDVRTAKSDGAWVPDEAVDHTLSNGSVAMFQTDGGIHAKQAGAKGDDSTNDGAALVAADAWLVLNGLGDLSISDGTYQISSVFTISVGVGLIGQERSTSVIKQTNTSVGGIKLSGTNRVKNIRIEAPNTNTDTTTKALDLEGTADNIIEQVRILWFGYGLFGEGLTWRHSFTHVRIDNPTNTGIHFKDASVNLELLLDQCYVVNNSVLGLTNKTTIFIEGCKGITLRSFTSDGGTAVGTKNMGANIINSNVTMDVTHWEGYDVPDGMIAGTDFNSLIRVKGSELTHTATNIQTVTPTTAATGAVIYGEDSSRIVGFATIMSTSTKTAYTSQQLALSNAFGDNLYEAFAGDRALIFAEGGSKAGTAKFTRTGLETKDSTSTVSFTKDVNTISSIVFNGASGDLTDLVNQTSDGQIVRIVHRVVGVVVKNNARLRLQAAADFTATLNSMQKFEYTSEGDFWSEIAHVV